MNPSYALNVISVAREPVIADNCERLKVVAEIVVTRGEEKEVVSKSFHYPLNTTKAEIEADLEKVLAAFVSDQTAAAKSAAREAEYKQAEETEASLKDGLTLTPKETN